MRGDTEWFALNPSLAPHGAVFGRFFAGVTLLELPSGTIAVCGAYSCASRVDAERMAEEFRHDKRDLDGSRVYLKQLEAWRNT